MGEQNNNMSKMQNSDRLSENALIPPHPRPCGCDECVYAIKLRDAMAIKLTRNYIMYRRCGACIQDVHCLGIYDWCTCKMCGDKKK